MKNKQLKWLLYFDEEAGQGTEGGTGTETGTENGSQGTEKKPDNGTDDRKVAKYSDDDLDRIINQKFAKWQSAQQEKIDEATRLANMTAQERAEHERDKLQKELDELKHKTAVADMERTARNILLADGISVPDFLVSTLVREDAEETSKAVKTFAEAYKSSVQDAVKQQLTHNAPQTGGMSGLTKEAIMKVKDPIKRQALIKQNMALFKR